MTQYIEYILLALFAGIFLGGLIIMSFMGNRRWPTPGDYDMPLYQPPAYPYYPPVRRNSGDWILAALLALALLFALSVSKCEGAEPEGPVIGHYESGSGLPPPLLDIDY